MHQNGVSLNKVRDFRVEGNEFDDIQSSAIAIVDESKGTIARNKLRNVRGNGLYISGYSEVVVEANVIERDKYPGIAVLLGSTATLRGNSVRGVECSGICVRGAKRVDIHRLAVADVGECGISISDTAHCSIADSTFEGCKIAAIECYNRSQVRVTGSTILGCPIGVQVYTAANVRAEGNTAVNISAHLARAFFGGSAQVTGTHCTAVRDQVDFRTSGACIFNKNGFPQNWTTDETEAKRLCIDLAPAWVDELSGMCLKCRRRPRTTFLMDCCHLVYCDECAIAAKQADELCPLCRFPIVNTTHGYEASGTDVCLICSENPTTCIIVPCGHLGFCRACLETWYKNHKACPACGGEPSSFKEVIAKD
jgi:nitrous oxidase accessory protein NosD